MTEYKTKFAIGDLVYTADAYKLDRDVIKAIKIEGVKNKVSYGIKSKTSGALFSFCLSGGDGYDWFTSAEVFEDRESAEARHDNLKAKKDAEEAKEKLERKNERRRELEEEMRKLEED